MEIILSCSQIAVWLQRSEAAIKKMARLGQIHYIKSGKGLRFILSELEDWFGFNQRASRSGCI